MHSHAAEQDRPQFRPRTERPVPLIEQRREFLLLTLAEQRLPLQEFGDRPAFGPIEAEQ